MFYKPLITLDLTSTGSERPANTSRRNFLKVALAVTASVLGSSACSLSGLAPEGDVKTCYDKMDALLSSPPNAIKYSDETIIAPHDPEKPMYVKYDDIPPQLIASILVREDPGFFDHNGWDQRACLSAAVNNTVIDTQRGCSGITMQLVKWLLMGNKPQGWNTSPKGKMAQGALAEKLEERYNKKDILEAYLNIIDFPNDCKGILNAASKTFGITDLNLLNLKQCAHLSAGLGKPGRRELGTSEAKRATDHVLTLLNQSKYPESLIQNLGLDGEVLSSNAQAARQVVLATPEDGTDAFINWFRINHVTTDTYTTTLIPAVQRAANDTLNNAINSLRGSHRVTKGSIMVMDREGNVLGTSSTKEHNAFSATDQVGSLLKPLLLGLLADKLISQSPGEDPEEIYQAMLKIQIDNSPMVLSDGTEWPRGGGPPSPVTLREALQKSYNGVWARLIRLPTTINFSFNSDPSSTNTLDLNPEDLKNSLQTLLQDTGLTEKTITPAVITGSLDSSIAKIARVYAGFLNGGTVRTKANAIKHSGGWLSSPTESDNETYTLFSPEAADIVKRFLRLPLEEGGTAFKPGMVIPENAGAKTGTTDNYKNAWCVYLVGDYVVGMSVKNDRGDRLVGGNLAGYVRVLGDRLSSLLRQ